MRTRHRTDETRVKGSTNGAHLVERTLLRSDRPGASVHTVNFGVRSEKII